MAERIPINQLRDEFPDLELINHVSTGGQKAVYRAKNDTGEDIVLKILSVESREQAQRASREVEAMNRIGNSKLVDLKDSFEKRINDDLYFIMIEDYIEGETLRDIIDMGEYSIDLGIKVITDLIDVLCEFHEEKIVHRDIKPSNIIVTPDGKITLLDVGIARFLSKSTLTPSFRPHAPGTYPYSAPEQLENEKQLQDCRTDLFSVGIVMYESITGHNPFDVEGMSIPRAIQSGEKSDLQLRGVDEELNERLAKIFHNLTEKEPYQRYRKPEFVIEDINKLYDDNEINDRDTY